MQPQEIAFCYNFTTLTFYIFWFVKATQAILLEEHSKFNNFLLKKNTNYSSFSASFQQAVITPFLFWLILKSN